MFLYIIVLYTQKSISYFEYTDSYVACEPFYNSELKNVFCKMMSHTDIYCNEVL